MFFLSGRSEANLEGVAPVLAMCVRRAISTTSTDFAVFEGLRTEARQAELVAAGVSRTMHSYHLTGRAVDLVPYVNKRMQWQLPACEQVAIAMREAAYHFGCVLTWGAVWDSPLKALNLAKPGAEVSAYVLRYHSARQAEDIYPLVDGPHFQLEVG